MNKQVLTYERVRELFDYRSDGFLIWKVHKASRAKIGDVAGTKVTNYYSAVSVDYQRYYTHIVIWLWHKGYMPEGEVDHINRIKSDNRIENLREVSKQCNMRNTGNQKNNRSGVKGVWSHPSWGNVWRVGIKVNRKNHRIGSHRCFDEAVLHRLAAEQCLNWSGCDSSSPAYMYAVKNGLIKPYT